MSRKHPLRKSFVEMQQDCEEGFEDEKTIQHFPSPHAIGIGKYHFTLRYSSTERTMAKRGPFEKKSKTSTKE
jgi:hypothetical protein